MKNQHVGILILGMALVFFILVISFNNALSSIVNTQCTHGEMCPMHVTLKTQKVISYSLISLLIAIGAYIAFFLRGQQKKEPKRSSIPLSKDEKTIIALLDKEEGSAYQSDIIKHTQLSKVKISRLLDKMESKGLIERKRRGMTNIVVKK